LLLEQVEASRFRNPELLEDYPLKSLAAFALIACFLITGCGNDSKMPSAFRDELTADAALTPIPEPFRNVWAVEIADCDNARGATRINIDPSTISFPEGRFDVLSINEAYEGQLLLTVRFAGGPPQKHVLRLSNEWETLSYTGPGLVGTYHRCPV